MKSVIHVIALWLMLVALPFQGFASAGMLLCGSAKPVAQSEQGGHHDHAAMLAAGQDGGHADHGDQGGCHGAMGDCCVGAALAYALPQAPSHSLLAERLRLRDPVPPVPVDLALPKRPPRAAVA